MHIGIIAELFTIARKRSQPGRPSTENMTYAHNGILWKFEKPKSWHSQKTGWDLEIVLSEISHTRLVRQILRIVSYMKNLDVEPGIDGVTFIQDIEKPQPLFPPLPLHSFPSLSKYLELYKLWLLSPHALLEPLN